MSWNYRVQIHALFVVSMHSKERNLIGMGIEGLRELTMNHYNYKMSSLSHDTTVAISSTQCVNYSLFTLILCLT